MIRASAQGSAVVALAADLRSRQAEIEQAVLSRVVSLSPLPGAVGPEYADGLREAVAEGLGFGIAALEREDAGRLPVPDPLLAQARRAARSGVGLDTVLRRYVAGQALLGDFLVEEAEGLLDPAQLKRLLRRLAAAVDRLLEAVSRAYEEEREQRQLTSKRRRAALVDRLLAGEPLDLTELGYDLGACHVGLLASGPGAEDAAPAIARELGARLLPVEHSDGAFWAWLGRRAPFEGEEALRAAEAAKPTEAALALGEPADGLVGWRLTHRQARVAFAVARRRPGRVVRYADVALLAAALQDDLLTASLGRLYLAPLKAERDGGTALRETLRAYFASDRNISSAAAALGVNRRTVSNRLRTMERHIGRSLDACESDLQLALSLEQLERCPLA